MRFSDLYKTPFSRGFTLFITLFFFLTTTLQIYADPVTEIKKLKNQQIALGNKWIGTGTALILKYCSKKYSKLSRFFSAKKKRKHKEAKHKCALGKVYVKRGGQILESISELDKQIKAYGEDDGTNHECVAEATSTTYYGSDTSYTNYNSCKKAKCNPQTKKECKWTSGRCNISRLETRSSCIEEGGRWTNGFKNCRNVTTVASDCSTNDKKCKAREVASNQQPSEPASGDTNYSSCESEEDGKAPAETIPDIEDMVRKYADIESDVDFDDTHHIATYINDECSIPPYCRGVGEELLELADDGQYAMTFDVSPFSITMPDGQKFKDPFGKNEMKALGVPENQVNNTYKEARDVSEKIKKILSTGSSSLLSKLNSNLNSSSDSDPSVDRSAQNVANSELSGRGGGLDSGASENNGRLEGEANDNGSTASDYYAMLKKSRLKNKGDNLWNQDGNRNLQNLKFKRLGKEKIGHSFDNIFQMVSTSYKAVYDLE